MAALVPPSLDELAGDWIDLTVPFSAHTQSSDLDLPVITNFYGSVGCAPAAVRPVDLFAINSLEIYPFAGCGNSAANGWLVICLFIVPVGSPDNGQPLINTCLLYTSPSPRDRG